MDLQVMGSQPQKTSLRVLDSDILQRARKAREAGMSERDIEQNIQLDLAEKAASQRFSASQANQSSTDQPKDNFWASLLPMAGGALGAAGLAAAPFTGGASLLLSGLGGVIGSGVGKLAENKIEGRDLDEGLAGEAALGALGGAGRLFKGGRAVFRAGRAANSLDDFARLSGFAANNADDAARIARNANASSKVFKAGSNFRETARGLDDAGKVFPSASSRSQASEVMDTLKLKGSAKKQFRNIDDAINQIGNKADSIYKGVKKQMPVSSLTKDIRARARDILPDDSNAFKKAMGQVDSLISRSAKNGKLSATGMQGVKRTLAKNLDSVWKKIENGTTLTPRDQALLTAWDSVDNSLMRIAPNAKAMTKAQSVLMKSRSVLDKAQKGATLAGGVRSGTPNRVIQGSQDLLGRGLQNISRTPMQAPQGLLNASKGQAVSRLLTGELPIFGGMQPPQEESGLGAVDPSMVDQSRQQAINGLLAQGVTDPETILDYVNYDEQGNQIGDFTPEEVQQRISSVAPFVNQGMMFDPTTGSITSPQGIGAGLMEMGMMPGQEVIPREEILNAIVEDFGITGGQNVNKLITLYDFANQTGDFAPDDSMSDLSSDQQKELGKLTGIETSLNQLINQFQLAGGGQGIGGFFKQAGAKIPGVASDTRVYEGLRSSLIAPLARAISGEVGVLTDKDIKRAEGLLPKINDTEEEASARINNLQNLLEERKSNVLTTPTSSGGGSSQDDLMAGLAQLGF